MAASRPSGSFMAPLKTFLVLLAVVGVSGEGQAPQGAVPSEAAPGGGVVSLLAKSGSTKTNGTHNGETNGRLSVLIGGANAFATSTTDGTGNGDTSGSSGNNNGNNATGNGNGNGNGNNNAIITIQNDPTFLTCPPCQYYDPTQVLCITVQTCLASKTSPSPSPTTSGASTLSAPSAPSGAAAVASATSGIFTTTAGRRLLESREQHWAPFW